MAKKSAKKASSSKPAAKPAAVKGKRPAGKSEAASKSPKVKAATKVAAKPVAAKPSKTAQSKPAAVKTLVKTAPKPATAEAVKPDKKAVKPAKPSKPAKVVKTQPVASKPASKPEAASSSLKPLSRPVFKRYTAAGAEPERRGPMSEAELRKVDSGLTRKDLEHYREILMHRRTEILGDVESLQTESRNTDGGNLSNMPLHMADVGTDNYEQEFNLGLIESDRKLLREIDDAIIRIDKKTYGVCVESGKPIGKARLDAKPWARYCIEVAREKERQGQNGG